MTYYNNPDNYCDMCDSPVECCDCDCEDVGRTPEDIQFMEKLCRNLAKIGKEAVDKDNTRKQHTQLTRKVVGKKKSGSSKINITLWSSE
jgi:hypothetical protein